MSREAAQVVAELLRTAEEAQRYGPTPKAVRRYAALREWIFEHADETASPAETVGFEPASLVVRLLRSPSLEGFLLADAARLRDHLLPAPASAT